MQLNLFVPKGREGLLRALDEAARARGVGKNTLVLDAVEQYLHALNSEAPAPRLRTYRLGIQPWSREDVYEEREDHILGRGSLMISETPAEYDPG